MRRILSEKNIAAFLFVLVILTFSLAHEDSKKRSVNYNVNTKSLSPENKNTSLTSKTAEKTNVVNQ
jgi:hypothetical protein